MQVPRFKSREATDISVFFINLHNGCMDTHQLAKLVCVHQIESIVRYGYHETDDSFVHTANGVGMVSYPKMLFGETPSDYFRKMITYSADAGGHVLTQHGMTCDFGSMCRASMKTATEIYKKYGLEFDMTKRLEFDPNRTEMQPVGIDDIMKSHGVNPEWIEEIMSLRRVQARLESLREPD